MIAIDDNSIALHHDFPVTGFGTVATGSMTFGVTERSVNAGPSSIPTSAIGYQANAPAFGVGGIGLGSLGVGGIGLGSLGVGGIGLGSLGVGGIGLGSLGVGGIGLGSLGVGGIGLGSLGVGGIGLGSLGVGPIPLSAVPLLPDRIPGGWAQVLANVPSLNIRLLQDVTLADVFTLSPLPAEVTALTVGDVDWANSALTDLSPMSMVLGDTPVQAIANPSIDWCAELSALGDATCADAKSVNLVLLQLAHGRLNDKLAGTQLGMIDMDGSINFADGTSKPVTPAPLWTFPLSRIDMNLTDFGGLKIANLPAGVVTGACAGCITLNDAATKSAIASNAKVGDLAPAINTFTLAEATFALIPGTFLGAIPPAQSGALSYGAAPGMELLHYHMVLSLDAGKGTVSSPTATVKLPSSIRIVPGSTSSTVDGQPGTFTTDPTPSAPGTDITWTWPNLGSIPDGGVLHLDFAAYPGLVVGPVAAKEATVTATRGLFNVTLDTPAKLAMANTTITDGYFEPNSTVPATCPSGGVNTLVTGRVDYLHISHRDDVEYLCFPAPANGAIATVNVVPDGLDVDAALLLSKDTPREAPLRQPKTTSSPIATVGDVPASLLNGAVLGSDNVDFSIPAGYGVADISNQRGSGAENLAAVSTGAGFFIVEIVSHGGEISRQPISVNLSVTPVQALPTLPPRTYPFDPQPYSGSDETATTGTVPASIAADTKTLFLMNRNGMSDEYGATAATSVVNKLNSLISNSVVGPQVKGVVIGVDGDAAVKAALIAADNSPGDIALNNNAVRKINDLVDRLIAPSGAQITNIVIVGGTSMRTPLVRDFTIQANERSFAGSVRYGAANALSNALAMGYMPLDDAYFDLNPEITANSWRYSGAGGRAFETPTEINALIDKFIAKGGVLDLSTAAKAFVAGSDFMTDLAAQTQASNAANFGPNQPALTDNSWDEAALEGGLANARVASINAHFDTNRGLPPVGNQLFTTARVDSLALPQLAITSSIGCHAGLSQSDLLTADPAKLRDFAQALSAKGVAFAGPSTYGLGLVNGIGLHELLSKYFSENIGKMRTSGLTIGEALAQAEQRYVGGRLAYGAYDDKVNLSLYGLPMWRAAGAPAPTAPPVPTTNGIDPFTGLASTTVQVTPTFARVDTTDGSYFTVNGETQVVPDRPIQPGGGSVSVAPGTTGVFIDAATATDYEQGGAPFDPVMARAQFASSAPQAESQFASTFPESLATVTTTDGLAQVAYATGQFFDARLNGKKVVGTQRLFNNMQFVALKANAGNTDDIKPAATKFRAVVIGGVAYFRVDATDLTPTGTGVVKRVLLQIKPKGLANGTTFTKVDLAPTSGNTWSGAVQLGSGVTAIDGFGQVIDSNGNVGVFGPVDAAIPDALPDGIVATVAGQTVGLLYPTGLSIDVSVDGVSLGNYGTALTLPGYDGLHVVDLLTSTGKSGVLYVVTDTVGPQVTIFTPQNGALYTLNQTLKAQYFCRDAATVVASCTSPVASGANVDTSHPGLNTFTVSASDATSHNSSGSTSFTVSYNFTGFLTPLINNKLNMVEETVTIPAKWTLQDGTGNYIGDPLNPMKNIKSITSFTIACPNVGINYITNPGATGSAGLKYDATTKKYTYNITYQSAWQDTCRRFVVTTDDNVAHSFDWAID